MISAPATISCSPTSKPPTRLLPPTARQGKRKYPKASSTTRPTDPAVLAACKAARIAQGLYEDDIGLQYAISAEWIHRWEEGEWTLPPGTVKSICHDLGVVVTES